MRGAKGEEMAPEGRGRRGGGGTEISPPPPLPGQEARRESPGISEWKRGGGRGQTGGGKALGGAGSGFPLPTSPFVEFSGFWMDVAELGEGLKAPLKLSRPPSFGSLLPDFHGTSLE